MSNDPIRVVVWGENRHEQVEPSVAERYPDGMHGAIAKGVGEWLGGKASITTHTLDEPEHGLTGDVLNETDVLVWWGHAAHHEVDDEVVERVHRHVLAGMGLIVLHSGHWSKIFTKLMGTTCTLRWRSEHDRELVWTVNPQHPIARGIPNPIVIPEQEMYGEYFDVPTPDELDLHLGLHRRRGLPQRHDLPPRFRPHLLLQPRRPGLPGLPPRGREPRDRQRHRMGPSRPGARDAHAAALRDRRLLQRPGLPRGIRAMSFHAFRQLSIESEGPLRLIVVGAGGMGGAWARNIIDSPDAELVGVADLYPEAAAKLAAATGIEGLATGSEAIELARRAGADAIVNATIPEAHHPVTIAALNAGLPVLGEKPVASTVAEGLSLAAAAQHTGQLFMVSQNRRYHPALQQAKQRLAGLGAVGIVAVDFFKAPHFGGFRDEMASPLLLDMAIHQFDMARYLLDADPVSVSCEEYNPAWSWYAGDAAANAVVRHGRRRPLHVQRVLVQPRPRDLLERLLADLGRARLGPVGRRA